MALKNKSVGGSRKTSGHDVDEKADRREIRYKYERIQFFREHRAKGNGNSVECKGAIENVGFDPTQGHVLFGLRIHVKNASSLICNISFINKFDRNAISEIYV